MSWLELIAAALGLANISLLVRRSVWNYPFALAMVSLYGVLFFRERNLWGWGLWLRAQGRDGTVRVRTLPVRLRGAWALGGAVAAVGWGALMAGHTDAAFPWWDAGIAIASVIAQILLAKRYIENWWLWIAVDVASLPLYAAKGLYLTTGLYALMLLLSIAGLVEWRRAERTA